MAAGLSVACERAPGPPYSLAFSPDSASLRVLTAHQETTVPIAVTNTGLRAWDPARVHLSYHWLWLIPRELAHRSRTLPYHDGIRTELSGQIPSGGRVALDARVLAPKVPGLYWLQWDMVEEGATWFAQVSPRQPRQLVVVLPTLAGLVAPMPLVVVLIGLLATGRFAAPEVVWCATALLAKQLILFDQALLEPTAVAYWLAVVTAVVPPIALMAVLPRRVRAVAIVVVGACGSVLILGDIVYYRFFGDVLSAPAWLAAGQTGRVAASIRSLFTPDLLWLLIDLPFAAWLAVRLLDRRARTTTRRDRSVWVTSSIGALALSGVAMSAPRALGATSLNQMFRARAVMEQLGPFGYHTYDAWNYARVTWFRPSATDAQVEQAASWFADRAPLRSGPGSSSFALARGKSLIVIQVESLQDFMVDYRVDDQEVMPHLRRWTSDGVRFTNVTDQTNEGRTSDAEFVTMTSLLPLDHGAVAFRYPGNHYVGFPRVLAEHGYTTLSAVAFEAGFWNRRVLHPLYGFQQSLFEPDFQLTEQIGWGLNDHDFLQQMVPRIERLPRPFCAWLITLSLHHPFDGFPERHKVLKLGALEGTAFGNYLHTMRLFDQALGDFRDVLARDGLLNDVVIAVFGDHDAGFAHDPALARTIGIAPTEAGWTLADRVPLSVLLPGLSNPAIPATHLVSLPMGQSDFAPTLLALLGIDPAPLPYVGRNVLGRPDDPPILRPYGDWLDRSHLFLNRGAVEHRPVCYRTDPIRAADRDGCDQANVAAERARGVSGLVIADDLQDRLRSRLAQLLR